MNEPTQTRGPRASDVSGFDKILLESIDEGLLSLSKSVRHLIFYYLEKDFSLKKEDLPRKLEVFSSGLERILGAGGAVVERFVAEKLYSKLGLEYDTSLNLVDAVVFARKKAAGKAS